MPALSSLITYRPGKKARAAIKVPFSLLRGDSSIASPTASRSTQPRSTPIEVIDINHSRSSSVSASPQPIAAFPQPIAASPRPISASPQAISPSPQPVSPSPQVELDIDLSSSGFSDWLDHLGSPSEDNERQVSRPPDLFIGTGTVRPLSSQSDMTSSALSGTTIARALMSNSFILSADRASLYRSGAGLTRSDSTTLPRWSRNSSMLLSNDRFSIGLEPPPPIPSNAERLYEPPRKLRNTQVLSQDSDTPSSPPSSGHTSPQELEGLLNYYSLPDSPEVVAGFRPMVSPISEESSSQLSPPFPYRSDRPDSDISRNLGRENSYLGQRTRVRPPLPAGPRRPSQQIPTSPFPPSFQAPTPKWKGYTMEVAKWTFTSAQLQAIVARAIRQSAEASSIRLLKLEVIDDEIPEEIQRLESQRRNIKMRYRASARRRAMILDSLYSSLGSLENVDSDRPVRQLDELKELTQGLDRLAEEIHSVDLQLSHLESLIHVHTGSALALALRKLNSSFLKQAAENQVLRNQIQSLEAERDEAWHQAQSVANEYDQIRDKSSSTRPSRPKRRPMDILTTVSPRENSTILSSEITPTSETRALARAQDELYALLGITNPEHPLHRSEHPLHRSRSLSSAGSPRFLSPRSAESLRAPRRRSSSLPGGSSLTEAYTVMTDGDDSMFTLLPFQRNAILANIDMLSATE